MINNYMRDLFEQLIKINEAPVRPGERKDISFKLTKLDKVQSKLDAYKRSLSNMTGSALPPELQEEMDALQEKLGNEIKKVQSAYDQMYEKSLAASGRPIKMENVFKALAKNCKEIIKVYKELNRNNFSKQKFMYRGIGSSSDALYGKPFDARQPKDSNRELHELVNDTIKGLGFKADRGNAMFVTGDRSQASGYGTSLYILFPVDGFTYTWSRKEKDVVLDNSKKMLMIDSDVARKIRKIVREANEKDSTIPISYPDDLFTSGYEYDSDVAKVSSLIERGFLPDEVKTLLDDLLTDKSIQNYFNFTDTDLFQAILSNNEIYIRGDYYAINTDYLDQLSDFLKDVDVDSVELPESFGEVPDVIETGDIVKVISGSDEGKIGVVTYSYSASYEVKFQQDEETTVTKDQIELYKLPDGSIPTFKENQVVIVTNPDSYLYGSKVKLSTVYSSGKTETVDENGNFHTLWVSELSDYTPELEKQLENVPKPHKFTRGEFARVIDSNAEYYNDVGEVTYFYSGGKIELTFPGGIERTYTRRQIELASKPDEKETVSAESGIKVGDSIKIIEPTSSYYNQIGEVIEVGQTPDGKPFVRFKNDSSPSGIKTFAEWVEKVSKVPSFNIGDKVNVNWEPSAYSGQNGTIESGPDSDGDYKVLINGGGLTYVPVQGMRKLKDTETFDIGDKVKITTPNNAYYGKIGEIEEGPDDEGEYVVFFDKDGHSVWYDSTQFEKVEEPKATASFSEGDTVKITGPSAYNNNSYVGYGGTITSVSDDGKFVGVQLDPDTVLTYNIDNLEKSEDVSLKIGDRVNIIDSSSALYNTKGTIQKGPDSDGDFTLVLDTGAVIYANPNQLQKITDAAPEQETKDTIKVGDTVKNIKDGHKYYGQTGEVQTLYSSGNVGLVYSDGMQAIDPAAWLEKVQAPAQPEAPKFEVNDRVEVVSQFPSLIGMKGKVTHPSSPNYDVVGVQLDGNTAASSFPTSALKKINEPRPEEEIHIGDIIEVTNPDLESHGVEGKVTNIDGNMLVVDDPFSDEAVFVKKSDVSKTG
jgi:transcription antitermination factor NusG